ncbi:GLPGLI family protein [Flavobacterium sp.]|uniref:GLPGLI family protein n=1 Tax=Flavobacterium sp. TaxID=239 RepID=UPI0022C8EACC|nr:GLPGLI family protein [Flavobacterium sp.]MCZ8296212.1 GLPGLI family protein [Flavobacterium sp.]
MKKYFFYLLVTFVNFSYAQQINGEIEYVIQFPNPTKRIDIKKAFLTFNDSVSLFIYNRNDLVNKESSKEQNSNGISIKVVLSDSTGSFIYRNFKNEKIYFRNVKSKFLNGTYVNDNWKKINWTIAQDTMTIGNFKCKKAIGDFRGRKYTVWFTEMIPLPYGPWKLYGLPGLIIEASDDKNEFSAYVKTITINKTKKEINIPLPEKDDVVLNYKEYLDYQKKENQIYLDNLKAKMPRGINLSLKEKDIKTNPAELEWEKD